MEHSPPLFQKQATFVAMFALLTTSMSAMRSTTDAFNRAGIRDRLKVLVGGAPITSKHAMEIGANGYSETAVGAVTIARQAVANATHA